MKLAILFALFAVGRGLVVPSTPESAGTGAGAAVQPETTSASTPFIRQWANAAFNWLKNLNCSNLHQDFLSADACWIVKLSDKRDIRVYGVEPAKNVKFGLLFPDGGGGGAESKHRVFHDGILVVDPFPRARFGHQIVVFHADFNAGAGSQCAPEKGFAVGDNTCLQVVIRHNCDRPEYNVGPKAKNSTGCNYALFLPLVYAKDELPLQRNDRLKCFTGFDGFNHTCPKLRHHSETNSVLCDFKTWNSECRQEVNLIDETCTSSRICDRALLLSGGWNRQLSDLGTLHNLRQMRKLLISHGYLEDTIELFYANGFNLSTEDSRYFVYPSSRKREMRGYIRNVCRTDYCAQTFFIYLNNPTRADGSMILWDEFGDGLIHDSNTYSTREFFRDIENCKANQVIIVADQNYGKILVDAANARSSDLKNVIIFTSTSDFNWPTVKDRLSKHLLKHMYNDVCLTDLIMNDHYKHKQLPVFMGRDATLNSTLVGAPCNSLNTPDMLKYRGCSISPLSY